MKHIFTLICLYLTLTACSQKQVQDAARLTAQNICANASNCDAYTPEGNKARSPLPSKESTITSIEHVQERTYGGKYSH